jgi:hypothetical protein
MVGSVRETATNSIAKSEGICCAGGTFYAQDSNDQGESIRGLVDKGGLRVTFFIICPEITAWQTCGSGIPFRLQLALLSSAAKSGDAPTAARNNLIFKPV